MAARYRGAGGAPYDRRFASSPGPSIQSGPELGDDTLRPMRLKVLYTFDDENKTNCLARWPQILHVRTAMLNTQTQVGVIDLTTCIQAVTSASPEMLSSQSDDYTVYAYDYSEYDTPLVGQGMLRDVVRKASTSTSSFIDDGCSPMVTGVVCRNALGLFGNGIQETLEVKLRLTRVIHSGAAASPNVPAETQEVPDMSAPPAGIDAHVWLELLRSNPSIAAAIKSQSSTPLPPVEPRPASGLAQVQRLLSGSGSVQDHPGSLQHHHRRLSQASSTMGPETFRRASPTLSSRSTTSQHTLPTLSRNTSYFSSNDLLPTSRTNFAEDDDGSLDDRNDDGPARKRAKVVRADHPGKANFGGPADSLRVAASTAASVRVFQPTAQRVFSNPAISLEQAPRAPTPVPHEPLLRRPSGLGRAPSSLSQGTGLHYDSPSTASDDMLGLPMPDFASPEESRCGPGDTQSPAPIASSPPVLPTRSPMPSSPVLPTLPRPPPPLHQDSGFVSGGLEDGLEQSQSSECRPEGPVEIQSETHLEQEADAAKPNPRRKRAPRTQSASSSASTKNQTSRKRRGKTDQDSKEEPKSKIEGADLSHLNARRAAGFRRTSVSSSDALHDNAPSAPSLDTQATVTAPVLNGNWKLNTADDPPRRRKNGPAVASSEATQPDANTAQVGTSTASEAAAVSNKNTKSTGTTSGTEGPRPSYAKWSKEKRKAANQTRLTSALAQGLLPPFCGNCGTIDTPIWRKAYGKVMSGTADQVVVSNEEGGIIGLTVLERTADNTTVSYKIYKKTLQSTDEGFEEMLFCNPCGLWLMNHHYMRPPRRWEKSETSKRNRKKPRLQKVDDPESIMPSTDAVQPTSEIGFLASDMPSDLPLPNPDLMHQSQQDDTAFVPEQGPKESSAITNVPELPDIDMTTMAALERALQSSPPSFLDSSKRSPILVDQANRDPARRSLFSSPRTPGPLGFSIGSGNRSSGKRKNLPLDFISPSGRAGKENRSPRSKTPDPIFDLFQDLVTTPSKAKDAAVAAMLMATPKTPRNLLSTPSSKTRSASKRCFITANGSGKSCQVDIFAQNGPSAGLPSTPKGRKTPKGISRLGMTSSAALASVSPFPAAQLNQLLSEANHDSPARFLSEIGALPSARRDGNGAANDSSFAAFLGLGEQDSPSRLFRVQTAPNYEAQVPSSDADFLYGSSASHDFDFAVFTDADLGDLNTSLGHITEIEDAMPTTEQVAL